MSDFVFNSSESIKYEIDFSKVVWENKMFSVYEVRALHFGRNANGFDIPRSVVEEALPSFYNLPIYGIINAKKDDFIEHYRGKNDKEFSDSDIRVFGVIPESSKVELVEDGGKTFIVFQVIVYKSLLPYITKILMDRDFSIKMSIEFLLTEYHKDEDGYIVVDKMIPQAITALGRGIPEGIKGSSMKLARFSDQAISDKCNQFYTSFNSQKKVYLPDVVIQNMKHGLDLREKYNRGGNKQAVELAQDVVHYGFIFERDLDFIRAYFSENQPQEPGQEIITNKQILHKLYGGKEILEVTNGGDATSIKIFEEGGQKMDDKNVGDSANLEVNSTIYVDKTQTVIEETHLYDGDSGKSVDITQTITRHEGEVVETEEGEDEVHHDAQQEQVPPVVSQSDGNSDPAQAGCSEDLKLQVAALTQQLSERDKTIVELQAKCSDLEAKCVETQAAFNETSVELKKYQRKEEIGESLKLVEKFAHCFDEKAKEEFTALCSSESFEEIKARVQDKVMEFASAKKVVQQTALDKPVNPYYDPKAGIKQQEEAPYYTRSRCVVK